MLEFSSGLVLVWGSVQYSDINIDSSDGHPIVVTPAYNVNSVFNNFVFHRNPVSSYHYLMPCFYVSKGEYKIVLWRTSPNVVGTCLSPLVGYMIFGS